MGFDGLVRPQRSFQAWSIDHDAVSLGRPQQQLEGLRFVAKNFDRAVGRGGERLEHPRDGELKVRTDQEGATAHDRSRRQVFVRRLAA